jgi:GNAT superfamily N-acetyltransferase
LRDRTPKRHDKGRRPFVFRAVALTADLVPALDDFVADVWRLDGVLAEMHRGDVYTSLFFDGPIRLGDTATVWLDERSAVHGAAFFTGLTFDMVVRPEAAASALAEEMILWALAEAKRRQPEARFVRVARRPRLPARVALFERLGFTRRTEGAFVLSRSLDAVPPRGTLPVGWFCRGLRATDIPSRLRAHRDAFPGQVKAVADYKRLVNCDGYDPFLDLIVVDERRDVAAFCTAWFDLRNRTALFEPVGTRADVRHRGLARVVMSEELHRLQQLGATTAVVRAGSSNTPAIQCYESLGFTIVSDLFGFERPLSDAAL